MRVCCQSASSEDGPEGENNFTISAGYYPTVQAIMMQIEVKANHVLKSTNNEIKFR